MKELEALFDSKDMPTLWFTFSAANNHWLDFHHIEFHLIDNTLSKKHKATGWRNFIMENPHIFNSNFYDRVKILMNIWFGARGLDALYI